MLVEVLLCCVDAVFASVLVDEFATLATFVLAVVAGFVSVVSPDVCNTETFPVIAENDNNKAANIKVIAAVIVILDKTDCVPRGPNAVLEILLVNKAPASVLPGCNNTVATNTKHEMKNNP